MAFENSLISRPLTSTNMKASDLFVKCLEEEGVEYIFAVPGEENLDLLESIRLSSIKLIVNRHEQCSAMMAATYGRLTGKTGVCLSTLGPGATNLVTGMAYANLGGMPLLAITGQKGIRDNWQADFQVVDVVGMMTPLTKQSVSLSGPQQIPKEIRNMFKMATTERQGAVHVELPEDIGTEEVGDEHQPHTPVSVRRPIADAKGIHLAANSIRMAKHPVIIVSSRAQRTRVSASIKKFCDATNIYVIHTQLGKGVLGDDHKNSLYSFGLHKKDYVNCVLNKADVVITVGYSTAEYPPFVWNASRDKKILHIDFNAARNDSWYAPDTELVGDIAASLDMLKDALSDYAYSDEYPSTVKARLDEKLFVEGATDESFPLKPRRIVADCRAALGKSDIICMDNGIYKLWFSRHYKTFTFGTFLIDNALGTMGAGLPSAMAAKMVHPEKNVLAVCGDGGFMMNSQELETAVRLKLNVVILILNDNAYGFIKWKQQDHEFPSFGLDYGNPDFVKYAEAYGAKGFLVTKPDELASTLERAFKDDGPVIIECPIDYSENVQVWNKELDSLVC